MTGVADLIGKDRGAETRRQDQPAVVSRASAMAWICVIRRGVGMCRRRDKRGRGGQDREKG